VEVRAKGTVDGCHESLNAKEINWGNGTLQRQGNKSVDKKEKGKKRVSVTAPTV